MSNAQLKYAVLCERVVTNQETNNASIFEILEQFNLPKELLEKKPFHSPSGDTSINIIQNTSELFMVWRALDEAEYQGKVELLDPRRRLLGEGPFNLDLRGTKRSRVKFVLHQLPVTDFGTYTFVISLYDSESETWVEHGRVEVDIEELLENQLSNQP
jgi:hypothetical protein